MSDHKHCHHHHNECCSHEGGHHEAHEHEECCHAHHECQHHGEHEGFADQLLELADEAWMEVLKDKIKENISANSGANLDRLAKLVSESNNHRWKNKLSKKKSCEEYKEKIADFFMHE